MNKLQFAQIAFLADTCFHYNSNNRGTGKNGNCSYIKGCAIGRHIKNKELCRKLDTPKGGDEWQTSINNSYIFKKLPKKLKSLGQEFLSAVQALHDSQFFWNEYGLSVQGQRRAKFIMDRIMADRYQV